MGPISKYGEFLGGVSMVLGLFTRIGSGIIAINLTVAYTIVSNGAVFTSGELAFNYFLIGVCIFLFGPQRFSLDHLLFNKP